MVTRLEKVNGPTPRTPIGSFLPSTDFEREEVRKQLRRILASSVFHNSKRYASVLKYIVDQTLAGCGDRLKERTIGIEVFQRAPTYDTATDHVVRSAAGEVRKRLAQYYQQDGGGQLKIEVLPGSYVPQFRWANEHPSPAPPASHPDPNQTGSEAAPPPAERTSHRASNRLGWIAGVCLLLLAPLTVLLIKSAHPQDAFDRFWKPILSSRAPVLLCIGNVQGGRGSLEENSNLSPTLPLSDFENSPFETVNVRDVMTMTKFTRLMDSSRQQFEIKSQSDTTFTDLQNGPTILVGLLNNNWTERLMPKLRFTVELAASKVIIRDSNSALHQAWSVDNAMPYLNVSRDYALVLRMRDPKTEQMVVVAAGISVFGTYAAADFLTNRGEMNKLAAVAPPGWEQKNMELVLSTDVIRGRSGPATIVASHFW